MPLGLLGVDSLAPVTNATVEVAQSVVGIATPFRSLLPRMLLLVQHQAEDVQARHLKMAAFNAIAQISTRILDRRDQAFVI